MHYKFGEPAGRYIGPGGNYHVYSSTISDVPPEGFEELPVHKMAPGEFNFQYGPSTGGLVESAGLQFITPGEMINSVQVDPTYKTRKLKMKGLDIERAILTVERINGFHASSNTIAFILAVEEALGMEPDEEVQKARILQLELERIRSNFEVLKRMGEPAGFGVPVNQIGFLRERVSRIISKAAGHRFFFGVNSPGSALISNSGLNEKLSEIRKEFDRIFSGLLQSKIFLNRLQNSCITKGKFLTGPAARAAGLRYDAREDSDSLPYDETPFVPVVHEDGDIFSRMIVRGEEIFNSFDIISSLGTVRETPGIKVEKGTGEGSARVESPQGDIFYYVKVNNGTLEDVWYVTPGTLNVRAFMESMKGNLFPDFHFNWESFGIWISELGVEIQ